VARWRSPSRSGRVLGSLLCHGLLINPRPGSAADHDHRHLGVYRGLAEGISQARSVRNYLRMCSSSPGKGNGSECGVQLWILLVAIILAVMRCETPHPFGARFIDRQQENRRPVFPGPPARSIGSSSWSTRCPELSRACRPGYWFPKRVTTTRSDMGTATNSTSLPRVFSAAPAFFGGGWDDLGNRVAWVRISCLKMCWR